METMTPPLSTNILTAEPQSNSYDKGIINPIRKMRKVAPEGLGRQLAEDHAVSSMYSQEVKSAGSRPPPSCLPTLVGVTM